MDLVVAVDVRQIEDVRQDVALVEVQRPMDPKDLPLVRSVWRPVQIWQRMNHQSGEHQQSLATAGCLNGTKLLKVDLLRRTRIPGRWSLLLIQCRRPLQRHRR